MNTIIDRLKELFWKYPAFFMFMWGVLSGIILSLIILL